MGKQFRGNAGVSLSTLRRFACATYLVGTIPLLYGGLLIPMWGAVVLLLTLIGHWALGVRPIAATIIVLLFCALAVGLIASDELPRLIPSEGVLSAAVWLLICLAPCALLGLLGRADTGSSAQPVGG